MRVLAERDRRKSNKRLMQNRRWYNELIRVTAKDGSASDAEDRLLTIIKTFAPALISSSMILA